MDIQGKVACITGAASGMGAATARHLAAQGARVVLLDVNEAALKKVASSCDGLAIATDVTSESSLEAAFKKIEKNVGLAQVIVSCAGIVHGGRIAGRSGPHPLEDFRRVIEVNLIGSFNVMRIAAARLSAQAKPDVENGVIIQTASVAAYEGQIGQVAYSASKGGIVSMTLPAARELAKFGIRVMTIAPGLMETPMLQGIPEENRAALVAAIPFPKRFGTPEEYAALVAHIVSNAQLNGEVIRLDGALRMMA